MGGTDGRNLKNSTGEELMGEILKILLWEELIGGILKPKHRNRDTF